MTDNRPLPEGWVQDFDPQYQRPFWVDTRKQPPVSIWHHPLDGPEYQREQSRTSFAPPAVPPPGASPYDDKSPMPQPSPQPTSQPGSATELPQGSRKESKSSKLKSFLGMGSSSRPHHGQGYGSYGGGYQQKPYGNPYPQQQPYMQPQQPYMQPQQPMYVQQQPGRRTGGGGMGSMLPMAGGLGAGMLGGAFLAHEFDESQQDAYQDGYDDGGGGDFDGGDFGGDF